MYTSKEAHRVDRLVDARVAFEQHRDAILAVAPNELTATNVDINDAVEIVLGALPRIEPLETVIKRLPDGPARTVDQLRSLAMAVWHANSRAVSLATTNDADRIAGELRAVRARLAGVIRMLVAYEVLGNEAVLSNAPPRTHRLLAFEMETTVARLMAQRSAVEAMSPLRERELLEIARKAAALMTELCRHGTVREDGEDVAVTRWKAMTLLEREWDDVRRALRYLRWREEDADTLAPPLRRSRRKSRAKKKSVAETGQIEALRRTVGPERVVPVTDRHLVERASGTAHANEGGGRSGHADEPRAGAASRAENQRLAGASAGEGNAGLDELHIANSAAAQARGVDREIAGRVEQVADVERVRSADGGRLTIAGADTEATSSREASAPAALAPEPVAYRLAPRRSRHSA